MFESLLNVKYITSKNCFCSLSVNNFKHLQNKYVKLIFNDNEVAYVSIEFSSSSIDNESIGINSRFAKALGIDKNSLVAVTEVSHPPTIQSVTITAVNEDHFVLESMADTVQSTLLDQIRVLNNGLRFIIFIGTTIHIQVAVSDIKPVSPGIIDNLTEVVIKLPEKQPKQIANNKSKKENNNDNTNGPLEFLKEYDKEEDLVLRVVPFTELTDKIKDFMSPFSVFVFRDTVKANIKNTTKEPKIYFSKVLSTESEVKFAYVRLYIFEDFLEEFKLSKICSENIFVSDILIEHFNCPIGTRVLLQPYDKILPDVSEIEVYSKKNYSIDIRENFQQFLAENCSQHEFILNSDVVMDIDNKLRCFVRFQPPEAKFCFINSDFVRNYELVVINENVPQKEIIEKNEFTCDKFMVDVANYQDIIDKCLFLFVYNTKVYSKMYNILITGKPGTGKSVLVKIIANGVKCFPYFIYVKKISCKSIKGKTVESLHKLFSTTLFELIHRQPSLLILDDLDVICEKVNEGEAMAQNGVYFMRVSEMLEGLIREFCEHNAVGILATAQSTSKLNKFIYATRGNHLFKNVYEIAQLEKKDRKKLLDFFFSSYVLDSVDLDIFATKTESFVMHDMVDFVHKALFESYQEAYDKSEIKVRTEHCKTALDTVTETSLSGVSLHPPGDRDLDDVGGLTEAKMKLVETMLWPAKYPNLFSNAPLRLPSGFLLYGPPGTGKTILAGAAAKYCGLRLISIKGPELLSKYIGASEQAVRDVFHRAQSAKPCILFFDEFDSLAPRRGHDNTGVTDRVVNQLLTQLDGIETLSGVFVVTATSRPDLLDPALLRPGRLDIHVHCPLPDETSRLEILKVLSKSLKLSSDVRLAELAAATEGFSGADLQAILYTAQLDCFRGLLDEKEGKNMEEFESVIQHSQLLEALKNTRPSLSKMERLKYEKIYKNFQSDGSSDGFRPGSKATLA